MTYSKDLRLKVLETREKDNLSMKEVSKRFGVGVTSFMRWTKNLDSKKTRNKPAVKIDMDALRSDVKEFPDAYLKERAERLKVSHNLYLESIKALKRHL